MEKPLLDTIRKFVNQLEDINLHKPGTQMSLSLLVVMPYRYESGGQLKIDLSANFFDGTLHRTCKAASLDALMEEVKRRLGFESREAMKLQNIAESFKALEAPPDENDMFVKED